MSVPEIHGGGVLGEKVQGARRQLDTFYLDKAVKEVNYTSDEVSSLCPITGQPDWYTISIYIYYTPVGIESKSLKLYLQSFRNDGQFAEQFAATIAKDVKEALKIDEEDERLGVGVRVLVTQKPRGGVSITARAE